MIVRNLGFQQYHPCWEAMCHLAASRASSSPDEIWFVEHSPVFTLGLAGRHEHLLDPGEISVVRSDRGGQVTYHGPGQLVVYTMLDLQRLGLGVRKLVQLLEQSVIDLLGNYSVTAMRRPGAPGVYIDESKVAALGLRVRRGCTYHGLALNVAMDLEPFRRINPCGYPDLTVTQTSDHGIRGSVDELSQEILPHLLRNLGYNEGQVIFSNSYDANSHVD